MLKRLRWTIGLVLSFLLGSRAYADPAAHLHDAVAQGKVSVEVTAIGGSTGDTIQVSVKRLGTDVLRLDVAPGTVFRSVTGTVQDMVGARIKGERAGSSSYAVASEMNLADDVAHVYVIEAFCLDFHKANPAAGDKFRMEGPSAELAPMLTATSTAGRSTEQVQAALWIKRDGIGDAELGSRFPVAAGELAAARRWLGELARTASPESGSPQAHDAEDRVADEIAVQKLLDLCFEKYISSSAIPMLASVQEPLATRLGWCFFVAWHGTKSLDDGTFDKLLLALLKIQAETLLDLTKVGGFVDDLIANCAFQRTQEFRDLQRRYEADSALTPEWASGVVAWETRLRAAMSADITKPIEEAKAAIREGVRRHPEAVDAYRKWWEDIPADLARARARRAELLAQARKAAKNINPTASSESETGEKDLVEIAATAILIHLATSDVGSRVKYGGERGIGSLHGQSASTRIACALVALHGTKVPEPEPLKGLSVAMLKLALREKPELLSAELELFASRASLQNKVTQILADRAGADFSGDPSLIGIVDGLGPSAASIVAVATAVERQVPSIQADFGTLCALITDAIKAKSELAVPLRESPLRPGERQAIDRLDAAINSARSGTSAAKPRTPPR